MVGTSKQKLQPSHGQKVLNWEAPHLAKGSTIWFADLGIWRKEQLKALEKASLGIPILSLMLSLQPLGC